MNAFDLLFKKCDSNESVYFYTITPENEIWYLGASDVLKSCQGFKEPEYLDYIIETFIDKHPIYGEVGMWYVDENKPVLIEYEKFQPYMGITIEGDITLAKNPIQRNQLVCIRGTCSHLQCGGCTFQTPVEDDDYRYVLGKLPCCDKERKLLGTSVWSAKWANTLDIIRDILWWVVRCSSEHSSGLQVFIINFDFTPIQNQPSLSYRYSCFAVEIKGKTIRYISDIKERKKLFLEYSKFECIDYEIEDAINLSYFHEPSNFEFPKPRR